MYLDGGSILKYMEKVLGKLNISMYIFTPEQVVDVRFDFGLRRISGREYDYKALMEKSYPRVRERTIYKLTDEYYCNYVFLRYREHDEDRLLLIGPYIKLPMDTARITELAQQLSVAPRQINALEDCYANIPFMTDDSFLFAMINSLGETLWGDGKNYEITDINLEQLEFSRAVFTSHDEQEQEDTLVSMQLMETRYRWENELMLMVSRGQSNRAEKMLPDIGNISFKQRLADPIRNMKNYCIVCNTLMRKAAQQGGVHPVYLDKISSEYAVRIEAQTDIESISAMIVDMIHNYCRLVKKHSMKDYSQHVRHAIMLIDSQITKELSLRQIAAALELNPSYLSSLFRKETGHTLTEFVCMRRMEEGAKLLRNTSMQIQDVAVYSGITDANYFSKLFKKHMGSTPAEYRNQL